MAHLERACGERWVFCSYLALCISSLRLFLSYIFIMSCVILTYSICYHLSTMWCCKASWYSWCVVVTFDLPNAPGRVFSFHLTLQWTTTYILSYINMKILLNICPEKTFITRLFKHWIWLGITGYSLECSLECLYLSTVQCHSFVSSYPWQHLPLWSFQIFSMYFLHYGTCGTQDFIFSGQVTHFVILYSLCSLRVKLHSTNLIKQQNEKSGMFHSSK